MLIGELWLATGSSRRTRHSSASERHTHARGDKRTFIRPANLPSKGSAPSVPGSWKFCASYSGTAANVGTDTVYLYTNIQAPGSKGFWKEHGESVSGGANGTEC